MRLVFFGIYRYGVRSLEALLAHGHDVRLVVTKPSNGKEQQPVAEFAHDRGLPMLAPVDIGHEAVAREMAEAGGDLTVVAGFHKQIPDRLLSVTPKGTINVHGSWLPRYRGPTPWKHAIIHGETETGSTTHIMTPEVDRGPILKQCRFPIYDDDTGGLLFERTCDASANLLIETLDDIEADLVRPTEQDESLATYFPSLTDKDCRIDWSWPAERIRNFVRALNPRPGAWTEMNGRRHRVWEVAVTGAGVRVVRATAE